jgi:hypothetical protein
MICIPEKLNVLEYWEHIHGMDVFLESLDINDAGELRESTGWLHPFS